MATQLRYSIEFKRRIVQEYQAGETLHGLAKRHGISRNLVRIWAAKAEAGEFDDDLAAAGILQEYEARIGKLALENEFLKGASRHARQPTSGTTSVVAGPVVSRSPKDVG
jgi:transposase-like protein